jgi:hypothetical protein
MEKARLTNGNSSNNVDSYQPLKLLAISNPNPLPPNTLLSALQIPPSIAANLQNKNKRKGFKQSMDGIAAQRIIFEDNVSTPNSGNGTAAAATVNGGESGFGSGTNIRSRVTPPSEQTNLPSNIIVTSVDVEADYWPTHREDTFVGRKRQADDEEHSYTYDDQIVQESENLNTSNIDFDKIESRFDDLSSVQVDTTYPPSTLFAFKVSLPSTHC